MLKLSKLTDYAVVVLSHMKDGEDRPLSASCLAEASHVPEPTVSKVLKFLSRANLIVATRGANGGYSLGKPLEEISVKDVVEAIEGPISLTECTEEDHGCAMEKLCTSHGHWSGVNDDIKRVLQNTKLTAVVGQS